jgi:hypothetical protein
LSGGNNNQSLDDEYMRGDATGDGIIDGQDFGVWNANKFTGFQGWGGAIVNDPSSSWLNNFSSLLAQYQIYVNGQINGSLTAAQWQAFSNDLVTLLATL